MTDGLNLPNIQRQSVMEGLFWKGVRGCAITIVILVVAIAITLFIEAFPSLREFGWNFLIGKTWDPISGEFGAFPFVVGTLATGFLALIISFPFSFSISLFLSEYFKGPVALCIRVAIELLAGIPSIVFGFWGLFVMVPVVRNLEMAWGVTPYGVGILSASLLLALMIIPYSASLSREAMELVPKDLKEAAFAMGATRFDVIKKIVLPYASSGIFAGNFLALGRALGETMAVTMVIGNSSRIITSIFDPSNTMASVIANEFAEATEEIYLSSLVEIGLVLFAITMIINIAGKMIIQRMNVEN